MADSMRKWNTYFTDRSEAVEYAAEQNGSFAFLYDYPVLQYWKGNFHLLHLCERILTGVLQASVLINVEPDQFSI